MLAYHPITKHTIVFQKFDSKFVINICKGEFGLRFLPLLKIKPPQIPNIPEVSQTFIIKYEAPIHGNVEVQSLVFSLPT